MMFKIIKNSFTTEYHFLNHVRSLAGKHDTRVSEC